MKKLIEYKVVFPEEPSIEGEAQKIELKNKSNPFSILPNHAPMIAILQKGTLNIYGNNNEIEKYTYESGYIHINDEKIVINILY